MWFPFRVRVKFKVFVFALLTLAVLLTAQSNALAVVLEGQFKVKGSRVPARGLTITLLPGESEVVTNDQGKFRVENAERFPLKLIVNQDGFQRFETEISEAAAQAGPLELLIEKKEATDFETTIVSSVTRDPSKRELSIKKAASLPGAGAEPLRAVQNLPGVNRASGFSSQVIIQGSAPQDTRYSIDQHEIPIIFHFGGLSSVLNPELTQSFDYLSAGFQAPYGRAMGGVINLNTKQFDPKDPGRELLRGSAFVDTFNAGAAIETPVGEESRFALGARVSYIGTVLKAVLADREEVSLTAAPTYQDVSFLYETPLSNRARFRLLGIGSADNLELIVKEAGMDPGLRNDFKSSVAFFRLIPRVTWTHSSLAETDFSIGLGRDFLLNSAGDRYFNLRSTALTTRANHKRKMSEEWTAQVGFDHRYAWSDIALRLPATFSSGGIPNPISSGEERIIDLAQVKTHRLALYTQHSYQPQGSAWTLLPGLRMDYFTQNKDVTFSPRLGARYRLSPDSELVFGSGLYYQPPQEQETSPFFGNPGLKSPSAVQVRLGYEKDLSATWSRGSSLYSGVFGRWFRDLVINDVSKFYSNLGTGRALGWETQIQYPFEPWDLSLIYTLSRSTRQDPSRGEYLFNFDQTHLLTLIGGVNLPRNWRISARFRFVTGPLESVPLGGVGDLDNDVFIPIRGALNTERLDPFMMLDLRVDKKWVYDAWTLTLYLDIVNVLNRRNIENRSFSYDYRSSLPVEGIPILPTFGLRGEF